MIRQAAGWAGPGLQPGQQRLGAPRGLSCLPTPPCRATPRMPASGRSTGRRCVARRAHSRCRPPRAWSGPAARSAPAGAAQSGARWAAQRRPGPAAPAAPGERGGEGQEGEGEVKQWQGQEARLGRSEVQRLQPRLRGVGFVGEGPEGQGSGEQGVGQSLGSGAGWGRAQGGGSGWRELNIKPAAADCARQSSRSRVARSARPHQPQLKATERSSQVTSGCLR